MSQANQRETLSQRAARLREAQRASKTGPLIVAQEVVQIAAAWEREFRQEAGDLECTAWCRRALGNDLAYYQRRAHAVEVLGEAVRRTLCHDVAVWLVVKLPNVESRERAKLALMRECKVKNGHPLSKKQAERVLRALKLIDPPKSELQKSCRRCARLEKLLQENGIEFE